MKQFRFQYGDKFTKIVETPDNVEVIGLEFIDTLVVAGCKVSIVNNDTQQVVAEWIPAELQVIDADKVSLADPNIVWLKVRKKPVVVHALQMRAAFETTTLEGRIKGKAGDYLIIGVNGERYPIDKEIFEKTYDVLDDQTAIAAFVKSTTPPEAQQTEQQIIDSLCEEVSPSFRDAVAKAMAHGPVNIKKPDTSFGAVHGLEIDDDGGESLGKILNDKFKAPIFPVNKTKKTK